MTLWMGFLVKLSHKTLKICYLKMDDYYRKWGSIQYNAMMATVEGVEIQINLFLDFSFHNQTCYQIVTLDIRIQCRIHYTSQSLKSTNVLT